MIENRVLGLNHFLQLCLGTPLYASHRSLSDFLEKNTPPLVRHTPRHAQRRDRDTTAQYI